MQILQTARLRRGTGRMLFVFAFSVLGMLATRPIQAQSADEHKNDRKIVSRVEPEYPETLKRLFIGGVVRVEVVIAPSGSVDTTELLGGNPILGQSAMKAIKQWKFAPAPTKTKQVVQIPFDPHE